MMRMAKFVFRPTFARAVSVITLLFFGSSVRANEVERVLFSFPADGSTGANPNSGVIGDGQGNLYGTTHDGGAVNFGVVFKLHNGRERVLHTFDGNRDFGYPYGRLVIDAAGTIYGATEGGFVYKLTADGAYTKLHTFAGGNDGAGLIHGLTADADGNLYGTTEEGGGSSRCDNGCGTIFKLTPDGQETVLYSFGGGLHDGWNPKAGVTLDAAANLYGTTYQGGTYNRGTVFKLASDGLTVLYSFGAGHPFSAPIFDQSGNLYGTTSDFFGDIYKLTPDGTYTVLHHCDTSGEYPNWDLIIDKSGNLYGIFSAPGQVFKVAPDGTTTTLYEFAGGADGASPLGPLFMDPNGNLYGTTYYEGGGSGCVFKVLNDVN